VASIDPTAGFRLHVTVEVKLVAVNCCTALSGMVVELVLTVAVPVPGVGVGIAVEEELEPPQPIIKMNIAQPRRIPKIFAILPTPLKITFSA
jgi:hypothetical protein